MDMVAWIFLISLFKYLGWPTGKFSNCVLIYKLCLRFWNGPKGMQQSTVKQDDNGESAEQIGKATT